MSPPTLGVVVVTFNSTDVIFDCLETLLASQGVALTVAVVDNGSTDGTPQQLRDWAAGRQVWHPSDDLPFPPQPAARPLPLSTPDHDAGLTGGGHRVILVETGRNAGFAGGVNRGLEVLAALPELDRFWILNPDAAVPAGTARAFATQAVPAGGFSLMGGRVLYMHEPDVIQIDGGLLNRKTGITGNLNLFQKHSETAPGGTERTDFIMGGNLVASRAFYERVGPMVEDYFLYYEEVDWAMKRGDLPLAYCPDGIIFHRAGTAIGSPTLGRPASPFSLYFKHRARLMFIRRFYPASWPTAHAYTLAKAGQYFLKGFGPEARALLAGSFGKAPPAEVMARLSPEARKRIGH